jgi:tetratricopeptide (TPR) repeat protein
LPTVAPSKAQRFAFAVLKNLARVLQDLGSVDESLHVYAKAASVDARDVVLWYNFGALAATVGRLGLARRCLDEALCVSPAHWPSLELLVEARSKPARRARRSDRAPQVLYALGDAPACAQVLEMRLLAEDPGNARGRAVQALLAGATPADMRGSGDGELLDKHARNADAMRARHVQALTTCASVFDVP